MRIAIFGLGYVGCTAACCLAKEGHQIIGVDVVESKVASMNAGVPPIAEPGLEELLKEATANRLIESTTTIGSELQNCDMAIVCIGTPNAPDGSHNLSHIANVSRQIASDVSPTRTKPLTVVYRSTFRPGTTEQLIAPLFRKQLGENVGSVIELIYNPEFLRESTAIDDFFNPPKIVIGTADGNPSANMDLLNQNIDAPVFYTNFREAEITKFVDNAWHAVKVAYANEIGRICYKLDISARKVHEIFVSDTKLNISPYYTRPGGAFGGSCLPKDVRALQHMAMDIGANTHLVDSLLRSNESHKLFQFEHVTKDLAPGANILLVGLAFKENTDDLRESPNLDLARRLVEAGFRLSVYDSGLDVSKLVGQNLGYAYLHLPNLDTLLVDKETAESNQYDLVIAASSVAKEIQIKATKIIDIETIK